VGLVCVSVWGYDGGDATLKLAEQRGVALQLTNILRDVVEDAKRGRVYLPDDELAAHGFDHESFIDAMRRGDGDERFDRLMRFQIDRARSFYDASSPLEGFLPADCRPTCWAIMAVYRRLLEKIAADPRRVLHERVRLRKAQKVAVVLRAKFGGRPWEGD
jgi:phytoene synthase